MQTDDFDLAVIGGGINGAGIARDAAGRGLSVLLLERDDLAAHTSSASTKLIHGGLRYLEHYAFGLVRKSLAEREVLLGLAPHIIRPLRFVVPHDQGQRPAWLIRLGLFLYDHLAPRERLPGCEAIRLRRHPAGAALKPAFKRGFAYSDAWVDDARLVVLNAVDAAARGADVRTRCELVGATRDAEAWFLRLRHADGRADEVRASAVVNAAGPWVDRLLDQRLGVPSPHRVRLVKGSHLVTPRLFEHDYAYLFQHPDGRVVFAMPFEGRFTLIGTTDVEFDGDPRTATVSDEETDYLCRLVSRYFARPVSASDVVWRFAGVRPLLDDEAGRASAVTRDYALALDTGAAPVLSVFGGKLTTYRKLAEEAVERLLPLLGRAGAPRWTAQAPLPGGDLPAEDRDRLLADLRARHPWAPGPLAARWAASYGTRARQLIGDAEGLGDLGEEIVPGLHAVEVKWLMRTEFARTAEDILWRRTRLGLHLPPDSAARLEAWLAAHRA